MATSEEIIKHIRELVEKRTIKALNDVVEYATSQAQNQYDKFVIEVPSDDPYIWVKNTPIEQINKTTYSRTIQAIGDQVLFVEFGAGIYYYTDTEARLYQNYVGNPRPSSVLGIGEYGKHRGKDDIWFYKSQTGRESENAHLVKYNRSGEPIMITHGNRPARALYRSVGMAVRRLVGGKFR